MKRRISHDDSLSEEGGVNLTPLIDVVFLVLIMFILVAPMVELDKVELANGSSSKAKEISSVDKQSSITIHVHKDNSIWINTTIVNKNNLAFLLKQAYELHPTETPQLFHDKDAAFGTYQMIKNAAEEAGFTKIDVILNPH